MTIRRIGVALVAATLALTTTACGGKDTESSGEKYIAIISKGFQHQFWQAVKQGAEEEAKAEGVRITFEGPADETQVEAQVTMLQNALAKKPDALGFAALDSEAAASVLADYQKAKIPVIAFDSGVEGDIPVTTAATNNLAAAAEAAKHMSELLGGKGTVAVIAHDDTSLTGKQRQQGFLDWMKENAPGIKVLDPQISGGDQGKSADVAKSLLSAHPDIAGIYGTNEGAATGALKGVQEAKKTGVTVVGFDSGKAQIDAIKSGEMAGAITQNPVGMGKELVKAAVKAINGETLEKEIDTGYFWYDKTNIDDPQIQAVLYQ